MTKLGGTFTDVDPRVMTDEELLERIRPRGERFIVTRPEVAAPHEEYVNEQGIAIPAAAKRALRQWGLIAKVLALGDGIDADKSDIHVGDIVMVEEFSGTPLYLGRETPYWIIGIGDCLATVAGVRLGTVAEEEERSTRDLMRTLNPQAFGDAS